MAVNALLRIFLLVSAAAVLFFVIRKVKKSQFETMDAFFWLIFIAMMLAFAVFPGLAYALSGLFGFASPSNFVFLCVIAVLLMYVFSLNAKVTHLRGQVNRLIQEVALREKNEDDK